jgi:hypothetical protein
MVPAGDLGTLQQLLSQRLTFLDGRLKEEHQIALEMAEHLKWMTERCKGLEERLMDWEPSLQRDLKSILEYCLKSILEY